MKSWEAEEKPAGPTACQAKLAWPSMCCIEIEEICKGRGVPGLSVSHHTSQQRQTPAPTVPQATTLQGGEEKSSTCVLHTGTCSLCSRRTAHLKNQPGTR